MTESTMTTPAPRLTSLSHGGGCGCKIAPGVLAELLQRSASAAAFAQLLVGAETADDAAVYQLNDEQAVIATTDFFMPIVDDPFDFGRIAAANALSDVYAMGGVPILALAILGMPINVLPAEVIREILRGGEAICAQAGIPVAGGHSIDSRGAHLWPGRHRRCPSASREAQLVTPGWRCAGAGKTPRRRHSVGRAQEGAPREADYRTLIDTTTRLNVAGPGPCEAAGRARDDRCDRLWPAGTSARDVPWSRLSARVRMSHVPLLDNVLAMADAGCVTGASARNWASYWREVQLAPRLEGVQRSPVVRSANLRRSVGCLR